MITFLSTTVSPSSAFHLIGKSWRSRSINTYRRNSNSALFTTSKSKASQKRKTPSLTYADILQMEDGALHPSQFHKGAGDNGSIKSPSALSPSAAAEFRACPQSYLFQYLYGIRQPTTLPLARGRLCHSALEQLFDLKPHERTLEHLNNLFRKNWSEERLKDDYKNLFDVDVAVSEESGHSSSTASEFIRDLNKEREWGQEALGLLDNYYELEDPRLVPRTNPIEREMWVQTKLNMDASKGVTGTNSNSSNSNNIDEAKFLIRGIVDRLDFVGIPNTPRSAFVDENINNERSGCIRIVDYKTGKAPDFKYSPETNERIANENMWQLKIYALLLREMIAAGKTKSKGRNLKNVLGTDIRLMRLMYLTNNRGDAQYLDLDLGETEEDRNAILNQVHVDLIEVWQGIQKLVGEGDPLNFEHCDRKFCCCHKIRPKFECGSVHQQQS